MTALSDQRRWNVQLYAVVRIEMDDVVAASPREAVAAARQRTDLRGQLNGNAEYAEELSHFVVHVRGDDRQCQSFYSRDQPLLANLARLLIWADGQRDPSELARILNDARSIVADSI